MYEKTYGYFRSSPKEQNENSYLTKLLGAGVPENQIYRDKVSSTGSDCTAFRQLLKKLNVGDTLFVVKLDHLGKNCDDVKNHWQIITKERGCELDMPMLDTRLGETVKYVVI